MLDGHSHYAIWGALQSKRCLLNLKNVFDKVEQYYTFRTDDPTAFGSMSAMEILTEMLQSGLYVPATSFATVGGRFLSEETINACWRVRMEPIAITVADARAVFLPDSVVKRRFFDEPVRINAASSSNDVHVMDPDSIATQMVFRGLGGPLFRARLIDAAIAAGTLPDLRVPGDVTTSPTNAGKGHGHADLSEIMISDVDEPDRALSPRSNILFIQTAADAALVNADRIVGAINHNSDELHVAIERAVGHRTKYPSSSMPVRQANRVCPRSPVHCQSRPDVCARCRGFSWNKVKTPTHSSSGVVKDNWGIAIPISSLSMPDRTLSWTWIDSCDCAV